MPTAEKAERPGVQKLRKNTSLQPAACRRDCMISDVSDGGVKIIAEYPEIPSEFTVIFSEGRPRQCRLAWRIGCELGAQFLD